MKKDQKTSNQNNSVENIIEQPDNTVYSVDPAAYKYNKVAKFIQDHTQRLDIVIDEEVESREEQSDKANKYIDTIIQLANTPGITLVSRPKVTTNLTFTEKCLFKDKSRPGWRALVSISVHKAQKHKSVDDEIDLIDTSEFDYHDEQ